MDRRANAVLLVSAGALVASCVLVVSPDEYGAHCRLAGAQTDCGRCVEARCQAEVDACCRDGACDGTLADLEGCASARDARCDAVRSAAGARSSTALGACATRRCGGACAKAAGPSETRCAEPPLAEGRACACSVTAASNSIVCGEATYAGTICCAPAGWPAPGLECSCLPVGCAPSSDGCVCFRDDFGAGESTCAGVKCCAGDDGCVCGTRPCQSFQRAVPSCTPADVGCPRGQTRVTACSVP